MPFSGSSDEYSGKLVENPRFPNNRRKLRHKPAKEQQALTSEGNVVEDIISKGGSKKDQDVHAQGVSMIVRDTKPAKKDASRMKGVENTSQLTKLKESSTSATEKKGKPNKCLLHVAEYKKNHPNIKYSQVLKDAKKTYKKG